MADSVVISGLGAVTFLGEGAPLLELLLGEAPPPAPAREEVEPGLEVTVGRLGRLLRHPFRERFERMSQLDAFSQYAVIATGHALDDAAILASDGRFEEVGVMLGSCFGCQEANLLFDQFELDPQNGAAGVRPAVFKNTVDNVPAGWVALGYKLRGVNATYVSGPGAGAEALLSAAWAIEDGRAPQVVAGGVERLIPLELAALARRGPEGPTPFPAEGAAVIVFEGAERAVGRGHRPRARLLAATRLPDDDPEALRGWLDDSGAAPGEPRLVSVVGAAASVRARGAALLEAAGLGGPFLVESDRAGHLLGAQAPLSLALLVVRLERALADGSAAQALLWAEGEPGEAFLFLLG